jgi:hypothetical protein
MNNITENALIVGAFTLCIYIAGNYYDQACQAKKIN